MRKLAADMRADSRVEKMFIYSRERDCEYSELTCMSKAWKCQVKVVFVYRSKGTVFPLITNDLPLTAKQMIEYYSARWKIESGFQSDQCSQSGRNPGDYSGVSRSDSASDSLPLHLD